MKPAVSLSAWLKFAAAIFCLTLGIVFLNCAPLSAQGTAGKILGTVTDQSGGAIASATVTVTDVDRAAPRVLMTDQAGTYNAPNLLPSNYKVRAEAKGFKTFERTGIILDVNAELRIDVTMQPGEVSQTITVNESVPMVETTNAELGATLQSSIIEDIPLNGRNFENLLQLNPGVTIYPGGSGMTQSANGLRPRDNVYMVNGIMATDPWMGQSVFNAVMAAGDAGTIMPMDAIDEFKTEMNPRAEYGWKPGAIVNVGVKSGTNSIHGSAYAYGRDTAFDARNYFNPASAPASVPSGTLNFSKQPVELEQFGATLGGPIKKDKLFYFVNFESQRYGIGNPNSIVTPLTVGAGTAGGGKNCNSTQMTTPGTAFGNCKSSMIDACTDLNFLGTPPTPLSLSLAGLDASCNPIASKLTTDPSGLKFQGLFPVNSSGSVPTDLISNNRINGGLAKVNYHLNDKNQLEGMYFISEGNSTSVDGPTNEVSNSWISAQHARSEAVSGDWAYTPNSTLVNEVRFGYAHYYQLFLGTDSNQNAANYNFNGQTYEFPTGINPAGYGISYGGAPDLRFQGFYAYPGNGIGVGWPKLVGPDGVTELLDHVSILKGKHAFKFGGEWIYNQSHTNETANAKGQLRFSSLENYLLGVVKQGNLFLGDAAVDLYNYGYAAFLQDDWRMTPKLTLNLGVRYEINTVVHEKNGLMGNFDPIRGLVQTNNPYNGDHNNFSPRVGFAWDIFGNGKTVLRGGGGVLYESLSFDVMNGEGNFLGLRAFPTGLPFYNNGSPTALPLAGSIQLQSLSFPQHSATLTPIDKAWQAFDPTIPVYNPDGTPRQQTLFASALTSPACGDGFTKPTLTTPAPPPCEVYGVDRNIRTPYVNSWNLDLQRAITNNLSIDIAYVGNHGTKLLGKQNINQPLPGSGWGNPSDPTTPAGQCIASATDGSVGSPNPAGTPFDNCGASSKLEQAAQPFTAPCAANGQLGAGLGAAGVNRPGGIFNPTNSCLSYLNYITLIKNTYESNYNGMQLTLTGRNYHGLSFTGAYTYSHALGDASDQGTSANFPVPLNNYGNIRQQMYANTDFDIRHRGTLSLDYVIPGKKGFGQMLDGWSINTVVIVTSGLPWGLSDGSDDFSGTNVIGTGAQSLGEQWNFFGNPKDFTPVHGWTDTNGGWQTGNGGLPYFGGGGAQGTETASAACNAKAAAIGPLAQASLNALGCYAVGSSVMIPAAFGSYGNTKPNIFRDNGFKNVDFSVTKTFVWKERFKAEARVEIFNILNKINFSNPSGGPGGAIQDPSTQPFGFVGLTPDTYSSNPQLGSGGERAMQLGLKLSW